MLPKIFTYVSVEEDKLKLYTSIEIINVLELNEVQSLMSLQLKLTVEWSDSRIGAFLDLKQKPNLNSLTPAEMNDIWMPTLVFTNTKNKQEANFKNQSTYATIKINEGTSSLACFNTKKINSIYSFWCQAKLFR